MALLSTDAAAVVVAPSEPPPASTAAPAAPEDLGSGVTAPPPDFMQPIENVTVAVGREAILSCSVTELGKFTCKQVLRHRDRVRGTSVRGADINSVTVFDTA
ncbi:hypothetical protein ONE63_000226 [Megalurothrips usitatus]|uniref:Uncharacterized protein n=1 Tax=Megalurothrips usitatus TaxID=439358 RepID=A0AAV7Y1M0_9NEOP|nr:hypothetical protein ONE63_000226 [Megalurothrips usitatus]